MEDLIGKDLALILPEPIRSFHPALFKFSNTSGKLLMAKDTRKVHCIDIEEYLIPVEVGLRFNINIDNGLEYIGMLYFDLVETPNRTLMADLAGNVTSISRELYPTFLPNTRMNNYNRDFDKLFLELRIVINEKLSLHGKSSNNMDYIFKGDKIKPWALYYEWTAQKMVNLLSSEAEFLKTMVRFTDFIVYMADTGYWVV